MTNVAAELEQELELENELEQQAEGEQEAFFNHLAAMADRGGRSQALRRLALRAAREALRGANRSFPTVEGEFESPEAEFELELEFDPARRANLEAMLEHLAHAAAEAQSEQEAAEQFLPLIPLAAKFALPLLGKAMPGIARLAPKVLGKVVPNLTRGIGNLSRTLYRNRVTRPFMHALPRIAQNTVANIARQIANGNSITPRSAALMLARQTARVLGNPRSLARTCRRSIAKDRIYHWRSRRLIGPAPRQIYARATVCPTCRR